MSNVDLGLRRLFSCRITTFAGSRAVLTTFVIGLREGLEASLIVGIIAAFLTRNGGDNGARAIRQMWIGVGLAVLICLAGGVTLALINAHLPQRQQEMLESVVAAIAVVMVTYMILWMSSHSRGLKGELESAAAGALARGSALALVVMAFLAVLREGFETSVFLLAAFGAAVSPVAAAAGVVLGLVVAIVLGYLIYRGGTRINLSRFFRVTGVVLVLVAGGLVMSTLQAAHEAVWLTVGQQPVFDLSWLVRPGSVPASLIGGVLGIQPQPPVIQVTAWLLYVVPMLAVVLWPRSRRLSVPATGRLLLAVGAVLAVAAITLTVAVPAVAAASATPLAVAGDGTARTTAGATDQEFSGTSTVTVTSAGGSELTAQVEADAVSGATRFAVTRSVDLDLLGTASVGGRAVNQYASASITDSAASGELPDSISGTEVTALNGGRLPIGLTAADGSATLAATYLDSWRLTLSYDPGSQVVVDARIHYVRALQVVNSTGLSISVGVIADVTTSATPGTLASRVAAVGTADDVARRAETWGHVVPAVLGVAAAILLAFGVALAFRRPDQPAPTTPLRTAEPVGSH